MERGSDVRVIVADDDESVLLTIRGFLEQLGHEVATAVDGREALRLLQGDDYRVVISDWEMPEMSGLEFCRYVRQRHLGPYVYFILLTSREGKTNLVQGLAAGADDFITKPFDPSEFQVRLRAAERIISLESRDLVIFALARLAESRDSVTGAHLDRIRSYSRVLAEELLRSGAFADEIDADFVKTIYETSPLHDIGKVGVPDSVLCKPGKFEPHEMEIMKTHTEIGRQTLDAALLAHPHAKFLRVARDIAWTHHERFDGRGYPRQLVGHEIPLCGRIVAVCDVYDALTTVRPYKPAFSHESAKAEIMAGAGTAFDPIIVDAFIRREHAFDTIRRDHGGQPVTPGPVTVPDDARNNQEAVLQ